MTFCQLELARGALSAIVSPALADALDWSALAVEPGSFVDAALAYQHTDLLYSLNWRDGSDALVYFLFEHQSTPPTTGLMGRRLMRYLDRIWDHWEADHPRAKTLPMILPIGPEAKDVIMTTGQQLRQESRQEGRQEMLLLVLRQRFSDAVTPQVEQRVASASRQLLETWSSRLFSAGTLAELLAD